MAKHRTIRGLPENLKETSLQIASDMESDAAEAKARLHKLRTMMSRDSFTVLQLAATGHGPRLLQQRFGGTTEQWRHRIWDVLGIAYAHSDAGKHYTELMQE